MAGQWQRDFFLITEDPFAVDLGTLDLWVEGYSVHEATDVRWRDIEESALAVAGGLAHGRVKTNQELNEDCLALLSQDCAQQYEAFEFLEEALADPIHFMEICPVQLPREVRQIFLRKYYSLDNQIVREILRQPSVLNIKLQGGGDKKAMFEIDQIARTTEQRSMKVARIVMNLQRVCRWLEHAACSCSRPEEAEATYPAGRLLVPEMEALQEPLCWRYRSLSFLLLNKFDLNSKFSRSLQTEHIEDVAAILLAVGGVPASCTEAPNSRLLSILVGEDTSAVHTSGNERHSERQVSAKSTGSQCSRRSVLDTSLQDQLQQLDKNILRPRFNDFKSILIQDMEQRGMEMNQSQKDGSQHSVSGGAPSGTTLPGDESRVSGLVGASMTFFRGGRLVKLRSSKLDPLVAALSAGLNTLLVPSEFPSFFCLLADFVEKLRQFDSVDPWEIFHRCYTAMETLAERDKDERRRGEALWPGWLRAWSQFLEFYRACAVCILSSRPLPSPAGTQHVDPSAASEEGLEHSASPDEESLTSRQLLQL